MRRDRQRAAEVEGRGRRQRGRSDQFQEISTVGLVGHGPPPDAWLCAMCERG
jgi:hypothetical protein